MKLQLFLFSCFHLHCYQKRPVTDCIEKIAAYYRMSFIRYARTHDVDYNEMYRITAVAALNEESRGMWQYIAENDFLFPLRLHQTVGFDQIFKKR